MVREPNYSTSDQPRALRSVRRRPLRTPGRGVPELALVEHRVEAHRLAVELVAPAQRRLPDAEHHEADRQDPVEDRGAEAGLDAPRP